MKKLLVLALCLFSAQLTLRAGDDKPIPVDQLPAAARQFIDANFKGADISFAKMDNDLIGKNYDVVFANGDKVEFDKNGRWIEVDCQYSQVPAAVVPQAIRNYVMKNNTGRKIVKIDRDSKGSEIKLDNGIELKFDKKFRLVGIDD